MTWLGIIALSSLMSVAQEVSKKELKPAGALVPTACGFNQLEYEKAWEPIEVCVYRVQSSDIEIISTRKPEGISYYRWQQVLSSDKQDFESWQARPALVEKSRFHWIYKGEQKDALSTEVRFYPETQKIVSTDLYFYVTLKPVYSTF
ncbi:MAG: hypothetical protein K2Q26_01975 [Bdellovibrionales bacterium]|nr:hypothetical protein [Bdellovibrionales bacterium]